MAISEHIKYCNNNDYCFITQLFSIPSLLVSEQFEDKISILSQDPIIVLVGACALVVAIVIIIVSWIIIVVLCCKRRTRYPPCNLNQETINGKGVTMHPYRPRYESVCVTSNSPDNTLTTRGDTITRPDEELAQQKLVITNVGYYDNRQGAAGH